MPSLCARSLRSAFVAVLTLSGLLLSLAPVSAQGFGVGGRIAWVHPDTQVDVDALRYFGGQIRMIGKRTGVELSMDRHSESSEALGLKITETPLQASILVRMAGGKIAPFLLGGPGWYRRTVGPLDGDGISTSIRRSSAGTPASASKSCRAGTSAFTATTATRSSTSVATITTRRESSAGSFRDTVARCGRWGLLSISSRC